MAKPLEVTELWQERILEQVSGLEYGQVIITIHDGKIVQIDRTVRTRYANNTLPNQTNQDEDQNQDQVSASHLQKKHQTKHQKKQSISIAK